MEEELSLAFNADQPAYAALRAIVAEGTTPLMAWVGSGLSRSAGFPSWPELKELLVVELEAKAASLDDDGVRRLSSTALAIRHEQNYWISFQRLREALGQTTFRDSIRRIFATAATVPIPAPYELLWRLPIGVLLNLNLDRLASRALAFSAPGRAQLEFSGSTVARLRQHLHTPRRLIGNLHGIVDDSETWVLTHDQLRELYEDPAYTGFIEACISTHAVLFVGLSVHDTAVGSHLARLASLTVETPTHYWITPRQDLATDQWAEAAGVRVIRYSARNDDHSEFEECLTDLITALPEEVEAAPPVTPAGEASPEPLPPPEELLAWPAEEIRQTLNAHARTILGGDGDEAYAEYDEFIQRYDQAIYRAWYSSPEPGSNVLLGYTLEREAARGAFGRVYRATRPRQPGESEGAPVAVKILREDIRREGDLLRTFRRGVRSMRILQEREVSGMVSYRDASEIPAFVVMDWIDGPNLADAVAALYVDRWEIILRIGADLSDILRTAHFLPERVLHRDLRPSNVMLSGYYGDPDEWDVVVLDFDLSWHRDAYEQSVLHTTAAGYLAPEQIRSVPGASTRHASVDSFGLGMTLFFVCGREEPLPDQHRHAGWAEQVQSACRRVPAETWLSLPDRFGRLIRSATADDQAARWDMSEIGREIAQLRAALASPTSVESVELLVEEIAARSPALRDYSWDADALEATRTVPTGLALTLGARLTDDRIVFRCQWGSTGTAERQSLARYVGPAVTSAVGRLRSAGWTIEHQESEGQALRVVASLDASVASSRLDEIARLLGEATAEISRLGSS